MSKMPVNPEVLIWAREESNLSIPEAAHQLSWNDTELRGYETGLDRPNKTKLQKMAQLYGVTLLCLLFDEPIEPEKRPKEFRTLDGRPAELSHETILAMRDVRNQHEDIEDIVLENREIFQYPNLSNYTLTEFKNEVVNIAQRERNRLGVSINEQIEWKNEIEAFKFWRARIESLGIFVYLFKAPIEECRGFSILEANGLPAIAINDSERTYPPKIFTLFHEYAHILIRDAGICLQERNNKTEAVCNRFAAEILMPIAALKEVIELPPDNVRKEWLEYQLRGGARKLKVSLLSFILRLEELQYAPKGYYDQWKRKLPKYRPQKGSGGYIHHLDKTIRKYGIRYIDIVFRALQKEAISKFEAYELVRKTPKYWTEFQNRINEYRGQYVGGE